MFIVMHIIFLDHSVLLLCEKSVKVEMLNLYLVIIDRLNLEIPNHI